MGVTTGATEPATMVSREKGFDMSEGPRSTDVEDSYLYSCAESSLGRLLVVMTDRGVVDVISGDSLKQLLSAAVARHPGAGFIPDRGAHGEWVAAVVRRVEMPGASIAVPYDLDAGYPRRAAS